MTTKIYSAPALVAFNTSRGRVAFTTKTGGGSYFVAADEGMQAAIEGHPWFGEKFFLEKEIGGETVDEPSSDTEAGAEAAAMVEKTFSNAEDAKEYVVQLTGLARTKLRTTADLKAAAETKGVKLVIE